MGSNISNPHTQSVSQPGLQDESSLVIRAAIASDHGVQIQRQFPRLQYLHRRERYTKKLIALFKSIEDESVTVQTCRSTEGMGLYAYTTRNGLDESLPVRNQVGFQYRSEGTQDQCHNGYYRLETMTGLKTRLSFLSSKSLTVSDGIDVPSLQFPLSSCAKMTALGYCRIASEQVLREEACNRPLDVPNKQVLNHRSTVRRCLCK